MPLRESRQNVNWRNPRVGTRIPEVDGLRGLAILLVLFYHYVTAIVAPRFPLWGIAMTGTRLFWAGVDLFFVLSGFLIAGILLDSRDSPQYFKTFYMRRIHRIFPLYFGWLVLFYAGVWLNLDRRLGTNLFRSGVPLWTYPLFLQNNAPLWFHSTTAGWMAMSWSLAVEEQFYMVLPALVRFCHRNALGFLAGAVIVLSPILRWLLAASNPHWNDAWPFVTASRLDGLAMGVAIALLARHRGCWEWLTQRPGLLRSVAAAMFAGFMAITACVTEPLTMAWFAFSWISASCAVLLLLALTQPQALISGFLRSPLLHYFGKISFAVYIFHQGIRGLFMDWIVPQWPRYGFLRVIAVTGLSLAVTLTLADLSWRWIESKLIRRAHLRYRYGESVHNKAILYTS